MATKKGPHLDWIIKTWGGGCKAKVAGTEFAAAVSENCRLQIVFEGKIGAEKEVKELKGGAGTECIIKAGPCEVVVPAANESTGENWKLGNTTGFNLGFNQIEQSNITGVTANKGKGSKALCTLKNNKTSSLTGVEFENVGENIV